MAYEQSLLSVIFFHTGIEIFSGGFGVDVFLVISGYLITTVLIEDIENKEFSIINFYERRARRILPAFFFMIFSASLLAGLFSLHIFIEIYFKQHLQLLSFPQISYYILSLDILLKSQN